MSKIPKIFKPEMEFIDNNRKAFYSYLKDTDEEVADNSLSVDEFFNKVSNSGTYVFNKKVIIVTNNKKYDTRIAGRFGDRIITLDGDSIKTGDIVKIYEKK